MNTKVFVRNYVLRLCNQVTDIFLCLVQVWIRTFKILYKDLFSFFM